MKRIIALMAGILTIFLVFSACSTENEKKDGKGFAYNKIVPEEISDESMLSQEIRDAIESMKRTRGYTYFKNDNGFTFIVFMGEKNTGGYSIKIKLVEDIEGVTKVTVEEIAPGKDDMVIQAFTYPMNIVKLAGITEKFEVVNENGDHYKLLTVNEDS